MSLTIALKEAPTPSSYVIVARTQVCDCCHSRHTWSETYSLSLARSRLGMGLIEELHSIREARYRVPISKRFSLKAERVPFCHSCNEPTLSNTSGLLEPPTSRDHLAIVNTTFPEAPKPFKTDSHEKAVKAAARPATAAEIDALIS